ncbi:uncharacterized protein [Primulina eburnea]|uniref:uncharacterized protein isoform X2 n=1 Tax=Primulina eburnea TaxID=1245227 RepID=UPI003C6C31ED
MSSAGWKWLAFDVELPYTEFANICSVTSIGLAGAQFSYPCWFGHVFALSRSYFEIRNSLVLDYRIINTAALELSYNEAEAY